MKDRQLKRLELYLDDESKDFASEEAKRLDFISNGEGNVSAYVRC